MLVLAFGIQKLGVHLQGFIEVKRLDVDQFHRVHLTLLGAEDLCGRVELSQPRLDGGELVELGDE
eukprot:COSAG05_NODE_6970_length_873_cov_1.290698_3_plen_64_part_01